MDDSAALMDKTANTFPVQVPVDAHGAPSIAASTEAWSSTKVNLSCNKAKVSCVFPGAAGKFFFKATSTRALITSAGFPGTTASVPSEKRAMSFLLRAEGGGRVISSSFAGDGWKVKMQTNVSQLLHIFGFHSVARNSTANF